MPGRSLHDLLGPLVAPPTSLDPIAEDVQGIVRRALQRLPGSRRVRGALAGEWFGHALHPALTDVPSGAWTLACLFDACDAVGMRSLRRVGDVAIGAGLAAVPVTAAAGLVDWSVLRGEPRRMGLVHASLNTVASAGYLISLVERCVGHRGAGRLWALGAYVMLNLAAYLGGTMVFGTGTAMDEMPEQTSATPVAPPPEMPSI